jgi:hypothetical protein
LGRERDAFSFQERPLMIERQGNMFAEYLSPEVIYVITTNGYIRNDGCAVLGRGVAKVAASLRKELPHILGDYLLSYGNFPFVLPGNFVTLPVKHRWDEKADPTLIERSLFILEDLIAAYGWTVASGKTIYLPRPGCGNGQLGWEQVRPLVEYHMNYENVVVWSL